MIERLQGVLVFVAALLGLALGVATPIGSVTGRLVVPALLVMLIGVFLQVTFEAIREVAAGIRVAVTSLGINFVWAPLLAWGLGALFLGAEPDLRIGLVALLVTPCTDWYLVFTGLARGNLALATALLPVNLVLQLVLLPLFLLLLVGTFVPVEVGRVLEAVGLMLLVPVTAATGLRALVVRTRGSRWLGEVALPGVSRATVVLLMVAVAAMFAWQGELLLERPETLARILVPVVAFFLLTFLLSQGRAERWGCATRSASR